MPRVILFPVALSQSAVNHARISEFIGLNSVCNEAERLFFYYADIIECERFQTPFLHKRLKSLHWFGENLSNKFFENPLAII
jgi:hypothetical protein